jgi:catechol 2,3-dioxygenase-like lactoylglutathione lyase family enzyme
MKLDGFGIFVKDMSTMVRFYRDVLGFEIKEEENTDAWNRKRNLKR